MEGRQRVYGGGKMTESREDPCFVREFLVYEKDKTGAVQD